MDIQRPFNPVTFCSFRGKSGSREDGTAEPDFSEQVRLAFKNLSATLKAAGCTFEDIIDVTTFHTDPQNQFATLLPIKDEFFPASPYPNWTAVGVTWLAGFDFEIKVIPHTASALAHRAVIRKTPSDGNLSCILSS